MNFGRVGFKSRGGFGGRRRSFRRGRRNFKSARRFAKSAKRIHALNRVPRGGYRV